MKKSSVLKAAIVSVLILIFSAALSASELRVYQLGSSWLVPDDYMDVIANPARINYIGRMIFSGILDNFVSKGNDSVSPDNTTWTLSPKVAHMGAYGDLGEGLIYRSSYGLYAIDNDETGHTLDNDLTVIFGKKFGEKLSLGMTANFQTSYKENEIPDVLTFGELRLGADYDFSGWNLGAVLRASNYFTGLDNADFGVKLLFGMKDAGGSEIRAVNETVYQHRKINPTIINIDSPFEENLFGYDRVDNNTGISYITTLGSVKCIIGVENNWKIREDYHTGYAAPFNTKTEEIIEGSENFLLRVSIETKIFTDWLILRTSYIPLSYTHNYRHYVMTINTNETINDSDLDMLSVFGGTNLTIGLGVELGKDMSIDVLINSVGLLSYTRGSGFITGSLPEYWMENEYSLVVAEFTLRM